jgi:hypothetical protein
MPGNANDLWTSPAYYHHRQARNMNKHAELFALCPFWWETMFTYKIQLIFDGTDTLQQNLQNVVYADHSAAPGLLCR